VSIADRDYFQRTLRSEAAVLSDPLVSRILGGWCVILARRVVDREGQAQGVVYAVLAAEHFTTLFAKLSLGGSGAISLRSDRLQLIARYSAADPGAAQALGTTKVSAELRALVERQVDSGRFVTATALDGIERVNALRRVPGYPLLLVAGLGSEAYVAPWRGHALRNWGFTVAVLLLVAGGSVYVDLQHRRLRHALARASALTAQQEKMLNNDLVGILKLKDHRVVWSNRASEAMFGYSHREMEGLPVRELYASDADFEAFGQRAYEVLSQGGPYRGQIQLVRRDGTPIWVDVSGVRLSPEAGEDLWMSLDITAMKRQHERVEHAAFHDALTGLPNRLLLMDRLRQAVQRCQRTHEMLAVCFLDLDGFKRVNDGLGHAAGDELLQIVTQRLQLELRAHDTVARVGGDEFVVLLPNLHSLAEAEEVAERLVLTVARPVTLHAGQVVQVGTSMGIACWPFDGQDEDSLLAAADRAMYADKAARRMMA
jgi:diguanylate cyclase (GGDEF)-like protein/PAS domain S-box-containing protein